MRCEEEFLEYLEKLVRDLDRRINRGKDRLKRSMEAKQRVCSEGGLWDSLGGRGGSNIKGWERGRKGAVTVLRGCACFLRCCMEKVVRPQRAQGG